jgi:hypothetical protein
MVGFWFSGFLAGFDWFWRGGFCGGKVHGARLYFVGRFRGNWFGRVRLLTNFWFWFGSGSGFGWFSLVFDWFLKLADPA